MILGCAHCSYCPDFGGCQGCELGYILNDDYTCHSELLQLHVYEQWIYHRGCLSERWYLVPVGQKPAQYCRHDILCQNFYLQFINTLKFNRHHFSKIHATLCILYCFYMYLFSRLSDDVTKVTLYHLSIETLILLGCPDIENEETCLQCGTDDRGRVFYNRECLCKWWGVCLQLFIHNRR